MPVTDTQIDTPQDTPHKDNIFGICNALGEDFGFNPFYLRAALALMLLVDAKLMLIGYGVAGLVVLASHLIVRPKRARKPVAEAGTGWTPAIPAVAIVRDRDAVCEPRPASRAPDLVAA